MRRIILGFLLLLFIGMPAAYVLQLRLPKFCIAGDAIAFVDKVKVPASSRGGRIASVSNSKRGRRLHPEQVDPYDGAAVIRDHVHFHELSYKGEEVMLDKFLANLEFVKFTLDQAQSAHPQMYFLNTKTHRAHTLFSQTVGLEYTSPFTRSEHQMKGVLVYRPALRSPGGQQGLYTFEFEPIDVYSFNMVKLCQEVLVKKMPTLKGNLGFYPRGEEAIATYLDEKSLYDAAGLKVYLDADLNTRDIAFLPLNVGESFGRLRVIRVDQRPAPNDIVLYETLPNELSRVAGIITSIRQTPLSHVNLRAIQDKLPNAFIAKAAENGTIKSLVGKWVRYKVTPEDYEIREATLAEVETHFSHLRPTEKQIPERDLSLTRIRSLDEIKFEDSASVGVKAANLAILQTMGFPEGTVPNGASIPFYFYDEFMKYNAFYKRAEEFLASPEFKRDRTEQEAMLKQFRSLIKKGKMPQWMVDSLDELQKSFPSTVSIRCRSSTNNEDLPGFSGAGLYDSCTHHPDEGHLSKSIKQIYASLWSFRAFEEREFYRVDHFRTAMAVLVHPNFSGELANGVAVTADVFYKNEGHYYLNTQIGEHLVTNPQDASIPEELLMDQSDSGQSRVIQNSNLGESRSMLLTAGHLEQLRDHLSVIHGRFAQLYNVDHKDKNFAMEIEFKVTNGGTLVIKQARPWVYSQFDGTQK